MNRLLLAVVQIKCDLYIKDSKSVEIFEDIKNSELHEVNILKDFNSKINRKTKQFCVSCIFESNYRKNTYRKR